MASIGQLELRIACIRSYKRRCVSMGCYFRYSSKAMCNYNLKQFVKDTSILIDINANDIADSIKLINDDLQEMKFTNFASNISYQLMRQNQRQSFCHQKLTKTK